MSKSYPSEERYPLLLLFLEDGQRLSKQHKKIVIDKNHRYQGITSGATAVITQWPGHLTTCWLTSLLIGLMLAFIAMMTFMLSVRPHLTLLSTVCKGNRMYVKENYSITVHLVHGPNPWLQNQLEFLEQIAKNYNQVTIELIQIQNEHEHNCTQHHTKYLSNPAQNTASTSLNTLKLGDGTSTNAPNISKIKPKLDTSKKVKRLKRYISKRKPILIRRKRFQFSINIGTKKLLHMLLGKKRKTDGVTNVETESPLVVKTIKTLDNLVQLYPHIYVTNLTYEEVFKSSPLRNNWKNLNETTRLFAVRVLEMWNYGGITFDIPDYTSRNLDNLNVSLQNQIDDNVKKFRKLVTIGVTSFKNLPDGLVTVDDEGYHMETKTICHAFFGELLMSIKKAHLNTMPDDIIKDALTLFCKRGAVDAEYCQKVKN